MSVEKNQELQLLNRDEYGEPDAPILLIVHGLFGSARNWRAIAKRMSAEYRVIVVDNRRPARRRNHPCQIIGHHRVIHHRIMKRMPMIAIIDNPANHQPAENDIGKQSEEEDRQNGG